MKTLVIEGKIIQVGKFETLQRSPKVTISIPSGDAPIDEDDDPEEHILELETDPETAKYFASHIFDRVRVSITLIPTPKLIDGGEEEDSPSEVRSRRKSDRLQNDDEAS